jgi:single-strand DNA-binding protein
MNKLILTGRLTKDVDVRVLQNEKQTKTCYYTIAVQDEFDYQKADFINCQSFGKAVDYLEKHGKKGAYIEFTGRLKTYQKDGNFNQIAVAERASIIFGISKSTEEQTEKQEENLNENPTDQPF